MVGLDCSRGDEETVGVLLLEDQEEIKA